MKRILTAILLPLLMGSGVTWAQMGSIRADMEVRGTVQLWSPAAQRIEVGGSTYRLARDVQVVDRETRLLPHHRVRSGLPVLLLITDGQFVTHVVVNPGSSSPFDRVGK